MDDSLIRIQQQPREIWLVKLADRISNLGPPPKSWSKKRVNRYWLESKKIYRELLCDSLLSDRLLSKIQQYALFVTEKENGPTI